MKKTLLIAVFGLLIGIGGYYFVSQTGPQGAAVGTFGTIKIGAALGLSGECAAWGESELKSTELAVEQANKKGGIKGRNIELIVEDTQCDSKGTISAIKKLIEVNQVVAIVGPTWGDSFQAGFTISNANKVVSICASCALEALSYNGVPYTYAFSTWFPAMSEMQFLAPYAAKKGVHTVYVLHDNDPFGGVYANEFSLHAKENGMQVVVDQKLPVGYDDYRTVIANIKSQSPDAVFASFQAPYSQAKFFKQAKELGLKSMLLTPSDIEDPSLLGDFGAAMEGVVYAYPLTSGGLDNYKEAYKEKFGVEPAGPSAANNYDATNIILAAITKNIETGVDLKTILERIQIDGTAVKKVQFDNTHQLFGAQYQIKTVRNGQFVVIE